MGRKRKTVTIPKPEPGSTLVVGECEINLSQSEREIRSAVVRALLGLTGGWDKRAKEIEALAAGGKLPRCLAGIGFEVQAAAFRAYSL